MCGVRREVERYVSKNPDSSVARPRKLKNPTISVIVVSTIDEDWAGSCFMAFNVIGIMAPDSPAITIEITIDKPMMSVKP